MSEHRSSVESVTMEQQSTQGAKSKVSRSAARHLRRKRLIAARREVDKNSSPESDNRNEKPKPGFKKDTSKSIVNVKNSNSKSVAEGDSNNVKHQNDSKITFALAHKREILDLLKSIDDIDINNLRNSNSYSNSKLNESNLLENTGTQTTITEVCNKKNNNSILNSSTNTSVSINQNLSVTKMDEQEKSREQVKAEREAKKAAKAATKAKGKVKDKVSSESAVPSQKVEKSETKEKPKLSNTSSGINTALSNLSTSVKQTVSQNVVIEEKRNPIDKSKLVKADAAEDKLAIEEKSKAELRAERRAKQEAQRAAKQASQTDKKKPVKVVSEKVVEKPAVQIIKEEPVKKSIIKTEIKDNLHEVNLFKHLYINKKNISQLINRNNVNIHPAILRLGVQYAEKVIVGSNARCVALLAAVKQLIEDFERPSQADFTRGLEASLQESVNYLNFCRPSAVSMQNALKHLKWQMSTLPSTIPDEEAKSKLANAIDVYIAEQIQLADKAISDAIQKKISKGDVILTYGFSSLIHKILCDAHDAGKKFRVVVIDGRPWLEGKELLRRLVKHGIDCSYMLINALSFIMPQVSKVFLGAHAILANGAVMSRVGTAQVAVMANAFNVPVLVACETHKSCERVQTDSIVYNEIGDPDQLVKNAFSNSKKSCLSNWKTRKTLNLLNITYDVTPADLVTAVVTELAILPCTSVPVILRIKPSESNY